MLKLNPKYYLLLFLFMFLGSSIRFSLEAKIATEKTVETSLKQSQKSDTIYRVQVCALPEPVKHVSRLYKITGLQGPFHLHESNNHFCYSVGNFKTFEDAMVYRKKIIEQGKVKRPFVIAFSKGERVPFRPKVSQ